MRTYLDKDGHTHSVDITLLTRRAIKVSHGIDLLDAAVRPDLLNEIMTKCEDDEFLFGLLSVIEGTTPEALLAVADGSMLEGAAAAFVQALIDFFPKSSPLRQPILDMVEKSIAYRTDVLTKIGDGMKLKVEQIDLPTVFSESTTVTSGSGESPLPVDTESLKQTA